MYLSAYLEVDCYTYEVIEQTHVTHTLDHDDDIWEWDLDLDWFGDWSNMIWYKYYKNFNIIMFN